MFGRLKQRWAEARGDVLLKEVDDAIQRVSRFPPPLRHFASTAFHGALGDLTSGNGPVRTWHPDMRKQAATELNRASRQLFRSATDNAIGEASVASSCGGAILSRYFEALDLPGTQAADAVKMIESWAEIEGS